MIRLRVREIAEQKGVTSAADLARRTGVAFATANKLWKNEISAGTDRDRGIGLLVLYQVAQALGVATHDLYVEDGQARLLATSEYSTSSRAGYERVGVVPAIPTAPLQYTRYRETAVAASG